MEQIINNADAFGAVFCLIFIAADYVSGIAKAVYNQDLDSGKMRTGLFHKLGFVGALALGYACQVGVNRGFFGEEFSAVFAGVTVWVLITEAISIFENLCVISPELAKSPLAALLNVTEDTKED